MGLMECRIDELFGNAARRFGRETALVYQEESYTWEELDILSDRAADRLEGQGVAKGSRVGLWGENSAAWVVVFLALQKLGAVPALLNFNFQWRELEQVVRISKIQWLCYGSAPALKKDPGRMEMAVNRFGEGFQGLMDIREESIKLREMLQDGSGQGTRIPVSSDCRDLACLLYTTGTSMAPKCVMHSHYSLVNNAVFTAERIRMDSKDRICVSQPLFHVFGLITSFLAAVCCGAKLCVLSHFGSEEILQCVQRHGCTILNGVPTNFICMLSNPAFYRYKTESLRLSVIGGANISATQLDYIREAFPTVHIMRNYGLTEGCNLCNHEYSDSVKAVGRSVGKPYPWIELAIQDPKERRFLPPGERGEIVVRGYSVMKGYFDSKGCGQAAQAIDQEGWLHTGDLGMVDSEGYVSIVGRLKDIIIRGGENIAPIEVSKEIQRYEPILDTLVIGVPHPVLGEEVVACLVLESPQDYSEPELRSMLKARLARYKIPAFFLVYDRFPSKPSGKVDMLALQKDAYAKVSSLHKDDKRYGVKL